MVFAVSADQARKALMSHLRQRRDAFRARRSAVIETGTQRRRRRRLAERAAYEALKDMNVIQDIEAGNV